MSKEKCRLCLCTTDSRAGISSSINDESFGAIIKSVFRFALPTFDTVGGRKNKLPALVCFQCSNTIRNFHYFSEHAKANQKKLQSQSEEIQGIQTLQATISDNWSIDELIEHIKGESEEDKAYPIARYVDTEEPDPGVDTSTFATEITKTTYYTPLTLTEPQTSVEKGKLAGTLKMIDKRGDSVTNLSGLLTRKFAHSQRLTKKPRMERQITFELSPIKTVEELHTVNQQLNNKAYREMVLDWLALNIDANDSHNRMHHSLDMIFDRAFLAGCNWTGVSRVKSVKKIGLMYYKNVIKLIQTIGGTDTAPVTPGELVQFLKNKLYHARERINLSRIRTSCRRTKKANK